MTEFTLTRDYIALDALLKLLSIASSGGEAKVMVLEGQVQVNGDVELRRGRKLRAGDCVDAGGETVRILAPA